MPLTKYKKGKRLQERKRRIKETEKEFEERAFRIKQARNSLSFEEFKKGLEESK